MQYVDLSPGRNTSITIRAATKARLTQAVELMANRGLAFSGQRLMRECLRFSLRFWRGRNDIASRNRKYNRRVGPYVIVPFYTTEALRRVSWTRCHHSGMSLSRLMDFAVQHYLTRVVEYWLRFAYVGRDKQDVEFWKSRYSQRRQRGRFIISYDGRTERNDGIVLSFTEKTEIQPWPPDLSIAV